MPNATELLNHTIAKVRDEPDMPDDAERSRAWVVLRPFAPGTEPLFLGSIWFYDDGRDDPRSPGLHLMPIDPAPGCPALFYMNLFFDNQTGGSTLLDRTPGWRRIDFIFALPAGVPALLVRALVEREQETEVAATDLGTLAMTHGVWRFRPAAANWLPLAPRQTPALRPAFVGGAPKSGTTWMQLLLNQHDAVYAMGEGQMLAHVSMRPYQTTNRWFPVDTTVEMRTAFATQATMLSLLQTYREHLGCAWVIDKSPGNAHQYRRLLAYYPGARLIHCIRHPLDVVVSRLHHEANLIGGGAPSPDMAAHAAEIALLPDKLKAGGPLALDPPLWAAVAKVLDDYALAQREAFETVRERPGRLLIVRYEDMLQDAEACAAGVFRHLGVPADAEQVQRCVQNVSFANLRERRGGRDHPFFRAGTADQFLARFTPADQERAMEHLARAAPHFAELGYAAAAASVT